MNQLDLFTPKRKKSYHNTVPVQGKELVRLNENAQRQESIILGIFMANPTKEYNVAKMCDELDAIGRTIYSVSVGRAMTNLLNQGYLAKTGNREMGRHGVLTGTYKLIKK